MSLIIELKETLLQLNNDNLKELKPKLIKYTNLLALSFDYSEKDDLTDKQLEELYCLIEEKHRFQQEMKADGYEIAAIIITRFKDAYNEFIEGIINSGFLFDAIELTSTMLKSIGGGARVIKLLGKAKNNPAYIDSVSYSNHLLGEFFKQIDVRASEGVFSKGFVVAGLVHAIKEDLEVSAKQHGRTLVSLINECELNLKELSNESPSITKYFEIGYGRELQRRIYMWDKLSFDLKYDYSLDKMLDEEEAECLD